MLSIGPPPDWKDHVAPTDYQDIIPTKYLGSPIFWLEEVTPNPVFLCQWRLNRNASDLFLFGHRNEMKKMRVDGKIRDGYFLNYLVIECSDTGATTKHMLQQHRSPIFSVQQEARDWVDAPSVKKQKTALSVGDPPKWRQSEALWPLASGEMMQFVGQTSVRHSSVAVEYFTTNLSIFLFWHQFQNQSCFKLFSMESNAQSVEAHYKSEQ